MDTASTGKYNIHRIRNIGISAHIDSGKTTLTERVLFYTGRVSQMHEVKGKDGVGALMDFMELERQRGITIQSAATNTRWRGHQINIIDTPGHVDFTVEVERALRVLDGAVLVLCAVGGVQSQTMTVNRQMNRYRVPRVLFINKLDRGGANPTRVLQQLRSKLGHNTAFTQIPIGLANENRGIIDLITQQAVYFDDPLGMNLRYEEIPTNYAAETKERRQELIECLAGCDEALGEQYVMEQPISEQEIKDAIRRCCVNLSFHPILVGTALKNRGIQPLLDSVIDYLPDPTQVDNFCLDERETAQSEMQQTSNAKNNTKKNQSISKQATDDESEAADSDQSVEEGPKKLLIQTEQMDSKDLICLAFKLEAGKYGQLTYVRVYRGQLNRGDYLVNTRTKRKVKVARLGQMNAQEMEDRAVVYSGEICALFGVDCASGDTFMHGDVPASSHISMETMFVPEPVMSMSIRPLDGTKNVEQFMKGLKRFAREDPTFQLSFSEEYKQTIVSGMGELQLDIYAERLNREYGVKCELGKPQVAFREQLVEPFQFDYFHKKQSGGAGQYARVIGVIEVLPPEQNTRLEFKSELVGTNVPRNYLPAIEKGFRNVCRAGGYITGNAVMGIRIRVIDGDHHVVDSSDWAFQLAAEAAMRQALAEGNWQVLEPVVSVETAAPSEYQGNLSQLLTRLNGIIVGNESIGDWTQINAEVPLNNMFGFVGRLRSQTEGKGEYSMEFSRYSPARPETVNAVREKYLEAERVKQGGGEKAAATAGSKKKR